MCDSNMKTAIMDSETCQPIYLIFEPVHDLKTCTITFNLVSCLNVRQWQRIFQPAAQYTSST